MNNSDQSAWQPFAKELAQQGFTALTFDFRGFGKSGGRPQLGLLDRDVRAAAAFLHDKGFAHQGGADGAAAEVPSRAPVRVCR